ASLSSVAQLERELQCSPENSVTTTKGKLANPEPRHVTYATYMAKKLAKGRRRSRKSEEKCPQLDMSDMERMEVRRLQWEIVQNLQSDEVVTTVNPGDAPVPYKKQGNPIVNTPQCVHQRHALRRSPFIEEISSEYLRFPSLLPDGGKEITKERYFKLSRKLHLALVSSSL
ncbi:unnamed protein product, partial [Choristocarpus tenellus]